MGTGAQLTVSQFRDPETSLLGLDAEVAARVISAAADVALVVDADGVIADLAFGVGEARRMSLQSWIGQAWVDTVAEDSVSKVKALLEEAGRDSAARAREINHRFEDSPDLPIRYSAVRLADDGRVLAIGRDLRAIANLQQQLVGAQQTMEREYARLRHLETRYRLLFQISTEPVLIAETSSDRISEVNPAAAELFGETTDRLVGRNLASVFSTEAWPHMRSMLDEVKVTGASRDVQVGLPFSETTVRASASLFRRESSSFYLVRLNAAGAGGESLAGEDSRLLEVLRGLPDAFVLIDSERRVIAVNGSFLDLAQLATEQQARRASLEDWLGRPGVDLNILMANLREHGSVRNFATVLRGQFGSVEEVEVSGVAATTGTEPCYGFMIRPVISRFDLETPLGGELPSSVQQLTGMVGRVPLKEIIRRTTDVIESLCIEAALEVSGDNRASAAQMLGLSRQSLYAKLRRHGIGDLDGGSSDS